MRTAPLHRCTPEAQPPALRFLTASTWPNIVGDFIVPISKVIWNSFLLTVLSSPPNDFVSSPGYSFMLCEAQNHR